MKKFVLFLFAFAPLVVFSNNIHAFDAPAYFTKNCSSCHTVGGGDDVGPDLKGISDRRSKEWLTTWIPSSQSMIEKGDPIGVELFNKFKRKKMPDQDLNPEEVAALLAFIKAGGPAEAPIDSRPASSATEADIAKGRELFLGKIPLSHGAPACISCHGAGGVGMLGGGTFAPNLTQAYSKYEDKGLSKSLAKPGFRVMKEVFADKPLTADEAFALKAFLYQTDKAGYQGGDEQKKFIFLGMGGCAVLLGVTDFIWRKRRRKSTKPWAKG